MTAILRRKNPDFWNNCFSLVGYCKLIIEGVQDVELWYWVLELLGCIAGLPLTAYKNSQNGLKETFNTIYEIVLSIEKTKDITKEKKLLKSFSKLLPLLMVNSVFNHFGASLRFKNLVELLQTQIQFLLEKKNLFIDFEPISDFGHFWIALRREAYFAHEIPAEAGFYESCCVKVLQYFYKSILRALRQSEEFFFDPEQIERIKEAGELIYKMNAPRYNMFLFQLNSSFIKPKENTKEKKEILAETIMTVLFGTTLLEHLPQRLLDPRDPNYYSYDLEQQVIQLISNILRQTENLLRFMVNLPAEGRQNLVLALTTKFLKCLFSRWLICTTWKLDRIKFGLALILEKESFEEALLNLFGYVVVMLKLPYGDKDELIDVIEIIACKFFFLKIAKTKIKYSLCKENKKEIVFLSALGCEIGEIELQMLLISPENFNMDLNLSYHQLSRLYKSYAELLLKFSFGKVFYKEKLKFIKKITIFQKKNG